MKSLMSDNQIYTFHRMCERYAQLFNQRVALESQVDIYNKRYHAALKDLGEVKTSLGKCREEHEKFWREVYAGVDFEKIEDDD